MESNASPEIIETGVVLMMPEVDAPLNLTTINDDCKELIFEHLEWSDLLNIAETNKKLYSAACIVFKRKYGKAKVNISGKIFYFK